MGSEIPEWAMEAARRIVQDEFVENGMKEPAAYYGNGNGDDEVIITACARGIERAASAVRSEQLSGESDDESDRAYERAINDALAAIRQLGDTP